MDAIASFHSLLMSPSRNLKFKLWKIIVINDFIEIQDPCGGARASAPGKSRAAESDAQ